MPRYDFSVAHLPTRLVSKEVCRDLSPWSQRREAKAIVKNVTVQPIKPVYVTLVFAWNLLAGILLLPQLQLLVCCIILPAVDLSAFLCNTVTS